MRFLRVEFVRWWQVLPVLVACWALYYHYVRGIRRREAIAPRFVTLSRRSRVAHDIAILVASLIAAAGLVFALLRPQVLVAERVPDLERQDLIIVLDRSASMRARDIAPSRSARATLEIRNFLEHKPEAIDRVGLVGFADASLILSYLTRDVESVAFYLDWIDGDTQAQFGTDIGAALKSAMEVATKDDRQTGKLFLLVSDGEEYGTELARQLAAFQKAGYRVHCIGVGSNDPVAVPVGGPAGREELLRDDAGQVVITRFQEATLREVAAVTGGRYVRSTTGAELARALEEIVAGERRVLGWRSTTGFRDMYPVGLAIAAVAYAALLVLL